MAKRAQGAKLADKVPQIVKKAVDDKAARNRFLQAYPEEIVDAIIFHRLNFAMTATNSLKSFRQLKTEFVDWNEIRVSPIQEIREQLCGGSTSLETAVFIKDFLEFVHREKQCVRLDFTELNLTEIRKLLRQVRGIDPSAIDLVLFRHKEHPVFPLNPQLETIAQFAGLTKARDTRDRKSKSIYGQTDPEIVLEFHHFLVDIARELSAAGDNGWTEDTTLKSHRTTLKNAVSAYVKKKRRAGSRAKPTQSTATKKSKSESAPNTAPKKSTAKK